MKKILLIPFFFLSLVTAKAQFGVPDPSFGTSGHLTFTNDGFTLTKLQSDGKLVALKTVNGVLNLTRFTLSGLPDASFGANGTASFDLGFAASYAVSFGIGTDGKFAVLANTFLFLNGQLERAAAILKITSAGFPDASFGTNGRVINLYSRGRDHDDLVDIAIQPNGQTVVLSSTASPAGGMATVFRIYDAGGNATFSEQFAGPGPFGNTAPSTLDIQDDGKIVIGAHYLKPVGLPLEKILLSRRHTNGTRDASFGTNGIAMLDVASNVRDLAITRDGKLLLATFDNRLFRVNADGALDDFFGTAGIIVPPFPVSKILLQGNGKIIIGGSSNGNFAIFRYNSDGTPDATFGTAGLVISDFGFDEAISDLVIFGNRLFAYGGNSAIHIIAAYLLESTLGLNCPGNIAVNNNPGGCSSVVTYAPPSPATPLPPGSYTITQTAGLPSGSAFPRGSTTNTFQLVSGGQTARCSFTVTVADIEAPVISNASATPSELWPPNNKMKDVQVNYTVSDNCGTATPRLTVTSGVAGDDIAGDWEVVDAHLVRLRAKRGPRGSKRIYVVTVMAADGSGNTAAQQVHVTIPHDQSGKDKAASLAERNAKEQPEGNFNATGLNVRVFSNPSSNGFTLLTSSSSNAPVSVRVMDGAGRVVETRTGIPSNGTLQLGTGYHQGSYYAELYQGKHNVTVKLLKGLK